MKNATIIAENESILDFAERVASSPKSTQDALAALAARGIQPVMGGAPTAPSHPLGPPVVDGTTITVDLMLNQPTRVTRMIMDLTLQRFIADRIFASAGGVTGGAVVYDEAVENELYTTRDVQRVAPGGEFPLVESERRAPKIAPVEKWGGKVFITDEARDRNDSASFVNKIRQLANTQVRKINQRSIEVLLASIAASDQTFTGRNWSTVVTGGASQTNADLWPLRDFAYAAQLAEQDELGVVYSLALMNPQEYTRLVIIYGARGLRELMAELGWTIYVSNRVPAGQVFYVAERQVGELRVEKPLGTATWREEKTERTFVQSSVRPVQYVTNPFAVVRSTGHAG